MLAEAGDWDSALEWGKSWLATNSGHVCVADVAICVAIAHCDQAAAELDSPSGDVHAAAEALESGLLLLRRYSCGKKLQTDIQQTLQVSKLARL